VSLSSKSIAAAVFFSLLSHAQVNILTANGDNDRSNSNLQETQLSPATVNSSTFGKLGTWPVDGQVYAQPLFVSGLSIAGGLHNVVFVSTMHNSVYAFDADAVSLVPVLWQVNLGKSVPATLLFGPYGDIQNEVGILGTGVIDLQRSVIYVVADVFEGGSPVFYLHALDLATGAERLNGPMKMTASVIGTGSAALADGTIPFDPLQHIQRPGLLLANNAIYVGFGSHGDQFPYHGWILSYDATDLSHRLGVYVSTPNGNGGAFWQSGRGLAADLQGNVYAITGNGDYDAVRNFSESFVKVSAQLSSTLDWFAPSDWQSMSDNDFDISAGPALIAGTHTIIGADKIGDLYVINGDGMNQPNSASIIAASAASIFNFAVWSRGGNASVYTQGGGEPVKCFQVTGSQVSPDPLSTGATSIEYSRISMTLSANGGLVGSGILWETTGDYNDGTPGTLHAYDASNLANELWNSDMNPVRDQMPKVTKFVAPTVANGKVYVPSTSNMVTVYGLYSPPSASGATPAITTVAHAASYSQDAVAPGEMVAIFGSSLGPLVPAGLQLDNSDSVATTLAGTQVLFDGIASPMVFAGDGQVNAIVPFGVAANTTQVQVQYQGLASAPFPMSVAPAVIGIFSADASGVGQAVMLNQDGSLNSPTNPAAPGSVVTLWATGAGQLSPAGVDGAVVAAGDQQRPVLTVTAQIGGQVVDVVYAGGSPGLVEGVIQVNLRIPAASPTGDAVPLALIVGNSTSQPNITLAIQPR
jgi:uncharacterized protein (TIGR03437 family)